VFMTRGKAGGALGADVEAIGRLISLGLRSGIPISEIYRQLRGISSDRVQGLGPNKVLSVPDAIGIAIERWLHDKQGVQQDLLATDLPAAEPMVAARPRAERGGQQPELLAHDADQHIGACPDCGSQLEYAEGCVKCHVCGYSECG
jgi:ribonucleoside-diphosphate reductase alpha chain